MQAGLKSMAGDAGSVDLSAALDVAGRESYAGRQNAGEAEDDHKGTCDVPSSPQLPRHTVRRDLPGVIGVQ